MTKSNIGIKIILFSGIDLSKISLIIINTNGKIIRLCLVSPKGTNLKK